MNISESIEPGSSIVGADLCTLLVHRGHTPAVAMWAIHELVTAGGFLVAAELKVNVLRRWGMTLAEHIEPGLVLDESGRVIRASDLFQTDPTRPTDWNTFRLIPVHERLWRLEKQASHPVADPPPDSPKVTTTADDAPSSPKKKYKRSMTVEAVDRDNAAVEERSWTQRDLDAAIRDYKAQRAASYNDLVDGIRQGRKGAKLSAKVAFGRNAIARELGVKSAAMVSKSPEWQAIADELKLPRGKDRHRRRPRKVGIDIAQEEHAVVTSVSAVDSLVRDETIGLIRQSMSSEAAEATIEKLLRGEITDDKARELVSAVREQVRESRTRKVRSSP